VKGVYIVGGYPDRKTFRDCFRLVPQTGFDFIEIGLPFNDPIADGPVITRALNETVNSGISTDDIIDDIIGLDDININKYIMTYSNIVFSYGIKEFSERLKGYIKGIIVADLPNRMTKIFYDNDFEIPIVPFATLETRAEDMGSINNSKSEFLYFVGLRGITGSKADFKSYELNSKINEIKKNL